MLRNVGAYARRSLCSRSLGTARPASTLPPDVEKVLSTPSWSVVEKLMKPVENASIISEKEMKRLLRLAFLSPEKEKLEGLRKDVSKILRFVEHIQEVDTSKVTAIPTVLENQHLQLRDDVAESAFSVEEMRKKKPPILNNAAKTHSAFFVVPKVKEDDVTN